MQKRIIALVILSMIISAGKTFSQCANLSISMPDTVCAGDVFQAMNTSSVTGTVEWNTCFGDLMTTPLGISIQINAALSNPWQIKMVKDNGKYHLFVANQSGNNLIRLDYGTSLFNNPAVYDYGSFGGVLVAPHGLDIVNDNGTWYALVSSFSNADLIRVNLGSTIDANVASAVNVGSPGNIAFTRLKIIKAAGIYYVFANGVNMHRFNFGNTLANTPTGYSNLAGAQFFAVQAFDMIYDCRQDKYIAALYNNAQSKLFIADFGNSPASAPTFSSGISQPSGVSVKIAQDGTSWHVLSVMGGAAAKLFNYKFGTSLVDTFQTVFADTVGAINNARHLDLIEDSSTVHLFVSTISPNTINRIRFQNPCGPGGGFSTDPASVSVTAGTGGYQYVNLSITEPSGVNHVYIDSLFVNPTPVSNFSSGPSCEGNPVDFTDLSTVPAGSITNWTWDFGDGSPVSNSPNPSHTFPSTGSYSVSLTTQSGQNCPSNTVILPVNISPVPQPSFTYTAQNCQGYPVLFNDNSTAPAGTINTGWMWTFSNDSTTDTLANTVQTFDSTGVFSITLVITNDAGCRDSVTQTIDIVATPVPDFSVTSTCIGETVQFSNLSSIQGGGALTYDWDFGDGVTSSGNNPSHQYISTTGNYDVSLIAESAFGCQDTIVKNIRIGEKPVPQFTWSPQIVCQGNQLTFTNSSTGTGADTISAYLWDFGDLNTSDLENPVHTYADTGFYSVTLTAISPSYCDSSITQQIYVIPGPEISFTATPVCLTNATGFNPLIITPPGTTVDSVVWDFGDGTIFNGLNSPSHTYSSFGSFGVSVTVYNDLLCTATFSDTVVVNPLPVADFSNSLPCSGDTIFFDGTLSQVPGNNISSWIWNFDGLGTSNDSMPEFTFSNSGTYDVTLIVNTVFGCSDTVQNQVSVIASPDFTFTFTEPCLGSGASFTYVSNITPTPPSNLIWNFGDGTISSALSPSHLFSGYGSYAVSLTVTNPNTGCSASEFSTLNVKANPQPGFIVLNNCQNQPLSFTDTSTVPVGSISSWLWDFGTLGTSTVQNPLLVSATSGTFPVSLQVTTSDGCSASFSASAEVYPLPVSSFVTDPVFGSPPLTVSCINTTAGASTYFWDFGDGNTSVLQQPDHLYADTGNYVITLISASDKGCTDTTYRTVSVLIPYLDLAILDVFSTVENGKVSLTARIANTGNITINEVDLRGTIEGSRPVTEARTGILLPGQVEVYRFVSSIEMDKYFIPSWFCVESTEVNDTIDKNLQNNKVCRTLSPEFELFSAYPQPFGNELTISFNLPESGAFKVSLYDLQGRLIRSQLPANGQKGFNTFQIETTGFAKGIYVISVSWNDNIRSLKAIKY